MVTAKRPDLENWYRYANLTNSNALVPDMSYRDLFDIVSYALTIEEELQVHIMTNANKPLSSSQLTTLSICNHAEILFGEERCCNRIANFAINTNLRGLDDLCFIPDKDILRHPGMGKTTLSLIRRHFPYGGLRQ